MYRQSPLDCQFEPMLGGGVKCIYCGYTRKSPSHRNCPKLKGPPKPLGLGDTIAGWLTAIGITEERWAGLFAWIRGQQKTDTCKKCKRRRQKLNWLVPYPLRKAPGIWARRIVAPWVRWARNWWAWLRPMCRGKT